jgi:hypothetical protein
MVNFQFDCICKKSLEEAAEFLYEDYKNDENLTEFTQLDGEDFYEAKLKNLAK